MTALIPLVVLLALGAGTANGSPLAAREVVVQPGETLPAVARRALGDEKAASELQALNQLSSAEVVAAGTKLRLPGPDRGDALKELSIAWNMVKQTTESPSQQAATGRLKEAESLFARAQYTEARQAAFDAWKLISETRQPTRFTVQVEESGRTRVASRSGKPVHVEAEGVTEKVAAGEVVMVDKGAAPQRPEVPPGAPELLKPIDRSRLGFKPSDRGLGPLALTWTPSQGARGYEVEVVAVDATGVTPLLLKAPKAEVRLPPLPRGRYRWTVRAVGETTQSEPSVTREFELVPDELKLEVRGTTWK